MVSARDLVDVGGDGGVGDQLVARPPTDARASADRGTAGCTAMGSQDLNRLLHWLDARQDPLVVQLPLPEYERLRVSWDLPALKAVL